eukprot:g274.t1
MEFGPSEGRRRMSPEALTIMKTRIGPEGYGSFMVMTLGVLPALPGAGACVNVHGGVFDKPDLVVQLLDPLFLEEQFANRKSTWRYLRDGLPCAADAAVLAQGEGAEKNGALLSAGASANFVTDWSSSTFGAAGRGIVCQGVAPPNLTGEALGYPLGIKKWRFIARFFPDDYMMKEPDASGATAQHEDDEEDSIIVDDTSMGDDAAKGQFLIEVLETDTDQLEDNWAGHREAALTKGSKILLVDPVDAAIRDTVRTRLGKFFPATIQNREAYTDQHAHYIWDRELVRTLLAPGMAFGRDWPLCVRRVLGSRPQKAPFNMKRGWPIVALDANDKPLLPSVREQPLDGTDALLPWPSPEADFAPIAINETMEFFHLSGRANIRKRSFQRNVAEVLSPEVKHTDQKRKRKWLELVVEEFAGSVELARRIKLAAGEDELYKEVARAEQDEHKHDKKIKKDRPAEPEEKVELRRQALVHLRILEGYPEAIRKKLLADVFRTPEHVTHQPDMARMQQVSDGDDRGQCSSERGLREDAFADEPSEDAPSSRHPLWGNRYNPNLFVLATSAATGAGGRENDLIYGDPESQLEERVFFDDPEDDSANQKKEPGEQQQAARHGPAAVARDEKVEYEAAERKKRLKEEIERRQRQTDRAEDRALNAEILPPRGVASNDLSRSASEFGDLSEKLWAELSSSKEPSNAFCVYEQPCFFWIRPAPEAQKNFWKTWDRGNGLGPRRWMG